MRIALVSDWYYPKVGGVASHMHHLAMHLRERGHEVAIVTNDLETGKEKELEELGIELRKIPGTVSPILGINLTYSLKSNKELGGYLKDFDVVHSHHAFTPLSLKAVKAGRNLGKATLMTTPRVLPLEGPRADVSPPQPLPELSPQDNSGEQRRQGFHRALHGLSSRGNPERC